MDLRHIDFSSKNQSEIFQDAKDSLDKHGGFIAKNLVDVQILKSIRQYISKLISLQIPDSECDILSCDSFDYKFKELIEKDRELGGVIYRACRRLYPLHFLSVEPNLMKLSKLLMGTDYLSCTNLKAIRIDYPKDDKFLFDLHQDYPYIMDSQNALVYWFPLRSITKELGPLKVYPGTHKMGLQKVRNVDPDNENKNGAKTIEISDIDNLKKLPSTDVEVEFGSCIVFSTLLLHQSSKNISDDFRWTIQVRHGDFTHSDAINRSWPGGMIEGEKFHEKHPEYVVKEA